MAKTITITLDLDSGDVKMEASGYSDSECLTATRPYEEALGTVSKRTMKPEAYQTKTQNRQQQGR